MSCLEALKMEINVPDVNAEVCAVFERYEQAILNNEVEVLDELFWSNELTVRYGFAENLYGIDQIREFRIGRSTGLARDLMRTVITSYDQNSATAMTEFQVADSDRIGRQSQTWVCRPEGWRVVAAHVSWLPS